MTTVETFKYSVDLELKDHRPVIFYDGPYGRVEIVKGVELLDDVVVKLRLDAKMAHALKSEIPLESIDLTTLAPQD